MTMDALRRKSATAVVLFCLGVVACSDRITAAQIEGRWSVTPESRRALGGPAGRMELLLNQDGTFRATDVPGGMLSVTQQASGVVSGSGRWKITEEDGREVLRLSFVEIAQVDRANAPYSVSLFVSQRRGVMSLYYFAGDPDDDSEIIFKKG